jgi:hypothetical protein
MKRILTIATVAALLAAPAAHAGDAFVARLVGITGNVLVSNDHNIASAGEALRLAAGMRVLVTTNSSAVIEYDDGCRIRVAAGERVEIRPDRPCGPRSLHLGGLVAPVIGKQR